MIVQSIPYPGAAGGTNIAFVGSKTAVAVDVSSLTVSLADLLDSGGSTATLLQNDFVLVAVSAGSISQSDLTFSESSSTWTIECDLLGTDSDKCNFAVFTKIMGATPDSSITISGLGGANGGTAVAVHAFRGVNASTPHDVTPATATGFDTGQPDPPSITPITSGAVIYVAGGANPGGVSGAVFTNPGDLNTGTNHFQTAVKTSVGDGTVIGAGFIEWDGSGAFDPAQWGGNSTSVSDSWCAISLALRPA